MSGVLTGEGSPSHLSPTYGSFCFPTPPVAAGGATPDISRREADLAQREEEVRQRELHLLERRTILGCEVGALRRIGRPLWRDAPLPWQLLCRRLWQLWCLSTMLVAWNWLVEMALSLEAGGEHYMQSSSVPPLVTAASNRQAPTTTSSGTTSTDAPTSAVPVVERHTVVTNTSGAHVDAVPPAHRLLQLAASTAMSGRGLGVAAPVTTVGGGAATVVGGQVGVATLLLMGVPVGSWLGWCHPLIEAALCHGAVDARTGWCGLLTLACHILLCGIAALGPPGFGLAGMRVALLAAHAGETWLALAAAVEAFGFLAAVLGGVDVYRRVLRSSLLKLPGAAHQCGTPAPPPLTPSAKGGGGVIATPGSALRVAYGRI